MAPRRTIFGFSRPRRRRLVAAAAALLVVAFLGAAVAQSATPPGPDELAWGAYRAGLGYPVFSEALFERADYEGIDPRCLMTITIAWEAAPTIVANVESGLMEVLVEGVTRAEAQAVLMAESPYFNAEIDCVGTWAGWGGGVFDSTYGDLDFGDGTGGRAPYEGGESVILYALDGHTMTGRWVEPASRVTCDVSVAGSEHWGSIEFEFDDDFTSFEGTWDYCGGDDEGAWNGTLIE